MSTLWYKEHMTRSQAIAIIEKSLPSADEATLNAAAELFQAALAEPSILPRELTARELALIAQSKEDFRLGRTLSSDEARASIDEALSALGVPKSTV
jgi:hypothetical protein